MSAPTPHDEGVSSPSRKGLIISTLLVVAVALAALAWWLSNRDDGSPTVTPTPAESASATASPSPTVTLSPSVTPSLTPDSTPDETTSSPSMADVEGRWCSSSPDEVPQSCVTVTLPWLTFDDLEFQMVAYPPGADIEADPENYDYSVPPNTGGCWLGGIDGWPATSGAPLMYCPAGADGGNNEFADLRGMAGPIDQDRFWPGFQATDDLPYLRVAD